MKNLEIFALYDSLNELSQKSDVKLPAKIGYICLKNKNLLEPYYKTISESRMQIIQEYAEVDEEGKMRVPEDKIQEANDKLEDLTIKKLVKNNPTMAKKFASISDDKKLIDYAESLPDTISSDIIDIEEI